MSESKAQTQEHGDSVSSDCYPTFVNLDGYWVNPMQVISVIHYDASEGQPRSAEKVVISLTDGKTIPLIGWTARMACQVVDKLEGRKVG